jgi:hypothetical protein
MTQKLRAETLLGATSRGARRRGVGGGHYRRSHVLEIESDASGSRERDLVPVVVTRSKVGLRARPAFGL